MNNFTIINRFFKTILLSRNNICSCSVLVFIRLLIRFVLLMSWCVFLWRHEFAWKQLSLLHVISFDNSNPASNSFIKLFPWCDASLTCDWQLQVKLNATKPFMFTKRNSFSLYSYHSRNRLLSNCLEKQYFCVLHLKKGLQKAAPTALFFSTPASAIFCLYSHQHCGVKDICKMHQ